MNNRIVALAGAVVLSLLTSVTLGAERDINDYLPSAAGLKPITDELKNQNDCPEGKFLKNVGPSLTNGSGGTCPIGSPGGFSETFVIDGTEVTIFLCWRTDNSVDFKVEGGRAHLVGVTSNTNDLLYPYANFTSGPVFSDGRLNDISEAADVNHTDWCVEPVETIPPVVGEISIDPSLDGKTVSRPGPISISTTVTDDSELQSVDIAIESVLTNPDGSPVFTVPAGAISLQQPIINDEYTWLLDLDPSFMIPDGDYVISVTATDVFLNPSLESTKVITVLPPNTSLAEGCLEIGAPPPGTEDPDGGCNNSGVQNYLLPDVLDGLLDGKTVEQKLAKAKLSAQNKYCGLDDTETVVVSEFVAWDPRVNPVTGELWTPGDPLLPSFPGAVLPDVNPDTGEITYPQLNLSTIFDLTDYFAPGVDPLTDRPLCPHCVGSPCLAVVTGKNNFQFKDLGLESSDYPNGPVATATQFPTLVQGLNRFSWIGALSDDQPDLRFVPQAAYLPTYLATGEAIIPEQEARQWTYEQWNPSRTKAVWDSLYPIGTVAACPGIDPSVIPDGLPPYVLAPETLPYFEAVQLCNVDLAVEYYDFLEETLILSEGTLNNTSLNELLSIVNQVRSMLKNGQCRKAESDLEALLQAVLAADFTLTTENYPGQAVMRILNLKHRNALNCEAQARLDAATRQFR